MGLLATFRHIKRLADVEERLRDLEAEMKALDREWSDVHEYLQRQLGKIAKRAKQIEKSETGAGSESGQQDSTAAGAEGPGQAAPLFGTKTATIMRQIAARRGG